MTDFDDVARAIARCDGYTINFVSMSVIEEADALEIGFRWGPGKPDITLSMQSVYYFALGRSPGADLLYVDKMLATPLPAGEPWPEEFTVDLPRTPDLGGGTARRPRCPGLLTERGPVGSAGLVAGASACAPGISQSSWSHCRHPARRPDSEPGERVERPPTTR
jgi:hypothetical protein